MKMRQLKKILSITLASAMLITSVPSGTFASESETLPTEQTSETGSGNEETGSGEQGSGSEETGSGETGSGSEETGSGEQGSGTEETGSGEQGSGSEETGSGEQGSGSTGNEGETTPGNGGTGSSGQDTGSNTGENDDETDNTTPGNSGTGEDSGDNTGNNEETGDTNTGNGETGENTGDNTGNGETTEEEAVVTVTWTCADGASFTYDGTDKAPKANTGGIAVSYRITKDGADVQDAKTPGSYVIEASAVNGETLSDNRISFTVTKAVVSINWENEKPTYTKPTYTGSAVELPKAEIESAVQGEENLEVSVAVADSDRGLLDENGNIINAGKYNLVAELKDTQKEYYQIKADGSARTVFEVLPCPIKVEWDSSKFTYNGTVQKPSVLSAKAETGETFTTEVSFSEENPINVGTYTATAEVLDPDGSGKPFVDSNYTVAGNALDFTIAFKEVEVVWDKESLSVVYNGQNQIPIAYFEGVNGDDTKIYCDVTVEVEGVKQGGATNAGTYKAFASVKDSNSNYTLKRETTEQTFEIKHCPITIEAAEGQSKTYGEDDPKFFGYTITNDKEGNPLSAGDIETGLGNEFKNLESINVDGKDRIQLLCRPDVGDKENGGEDAKEHELKLAFEENVIEKDGKYYSKNYEITYKKKSLTINRKEVEVVWDEESLSVVYNGQNQIPIAYFEGVNGDDTKIYCDVTVEVEGVKQGGATNAGTYKAFASVKDSNSNYTLDSNTTKFEIDKCPITITADAGQSKTYGEDDPKFFGYTIKNEDTSEAPISAGDIETGLGKEFENFESIKVVNVDGKDRIQLLCRPDKDKEGGEDAKVHELKLAFEKDGKYYSKNYKITYLMDVLTINKKEVEVVWDEESLSVVYNGQNQIPTAYFEGVRGDGKIDCMIVVQDEKTEYPGGATNAGTYQAVAFPTNSNYTLDSNTTKQKFEIDKCPITITAVKDQSKVYGALDPEFFGYTIENMDTSEAPISAGDIETGLGNEFKNLESINVDGKDRIQLLCRPDKDKEGGEDAKEHELSLAFEAEASGNYDITYNNNNKFTIERLSVTIEPIGGQGKIFGQENPEEYTYNLKSFDSRTKLLEKDIRVELGTKVLQRIAGEKVGSYKFLLDGTKETSDEYQDYEKNFSVKVLPTSAFTINPIEITEIAAIDSRQDRFTIKTDLDAENVKRVAGVTTSFVISLDFQGIGDEIGFSREIFDYIDVDRNSSVEFDGDTATIKIKSADYWKEVSNGETKTWKGGLPAGTKVSVSVKGVIKNGEDIVSEEIVSEEKKTVTVKKVKVSLDWDNTVERTNSDGTRYLIVDGNTTDKLVLKTTRMKEWVEMQCTGGNAKTVYSDMPERTYNYTPEASNNGSVHVTQTIKAGIVDTLNLDCDEVSLSFYVDNEAFSIPASQIQFENRGQEIKIQLPEMGTVTGVTIPGGTVAVGKESGKVSQEFSFPVSWSGKDLISTGTSISVEYKDQAEHVGKGTAVVTRSTVSTPITFRIRPELNASGYLNGRSSTLIVSGTACSCEPIKVTAADMSQSTFATQKEVWSDSNGSWEVLFDMSGLPEEQEFSISAEYVDVNGPGHSITARFDAFCADPAVVSPIYEAMTHISGMVEPGTAVALVVNGQEQNYYEIQVDRFGHFSMDDVPMMFGKTDEDGDGELEMGDTFDIYVTDIAGNVAIRHYEIDEPGDPFEVSSSVNPLGKFIYSAEEKDSVAYVATPVSLEDFEEEKDSLELPLLMGMSYEAGTLTLQKSENGFTVSSEIQIDEAVDAEDYRVENEKLYVYTAEPSVEDLENRTGQEYPYGAEIPLGEGETVWIVADSDMTILADDIMDLKLFDYENSEEYVKYQEQ